MVIETNRELTAEEAKEITSVMVHARQLLRKPDKKVPGIFRFCYMGAAFCALAVLFFTYFLIMISVIAIVFLVVFYLGVNKTYRTLLSHGSEHVIVTLDEKGIDYEVVGNRRFQSSWENIAFLRVLDQMIYLMPKDITGMLFSFEKKHLEELKNFLKENQIDLRIIE